MTTTDTSTLPDSTNSSSKARPHQEDNNNEPRKDDNTEMKGSSEEDGVKADDSNHGHGNHGHSKQDDRELSDQEKTQKMLEQLNLELEDRTSPGSDEDIDDRDCPEYDVKDRLKQLNADLANDTTPLKGDRKVMVAFKDDDHLVSVASPDEYPSDEEDNEDVSSKEKLQTEGGPNPTKTHIDDHQTDKGAITSDELPPTKDNHQEGVDCTDSESPQSSDKHDKVLIERDGKFELVSEEEMKAQGLDPALYAADPDNVDSDLIQEPSSVSAADHNSNEDNEKQPNNNQNSTVEPTSNHSNRDMQPSSGPVPVPPNYPRPHTATDSVRTRQIKTSPRRTQSATIANRTPKRLLWNFNYKSPYGLSESQLEIKRQRDEIAAKCKIEEIKGKKEEEKKRKEENEEMFQGWLEHKKRQIAEDKRKQKENEEIVTEEEKREKVGSQSEHAIEVKEAYEGWLATRLKKLQQQRLLEKREQREREEGFFTRPRDACNESFKLWLKGKNREITKEKSAYKKQAKFHKRRAEQSRKSLQLAKAVRQSESYRYVDYYGYRT